MASRPTQYCSVHGCDQLRHPSGRGYCLEHYKTNCSDFNYGLDAELKRKASMKYDPELERQAVTWIQAVIGESLVGAFADALKTGEVLCRLINALSPGRIKRINHTPMPFKQMENISAFIQGCRDLGVAEADLCSTLDLYEEKDLNAVVSCIHALGRAVQKNLPGYRGPRLGVSEATQNVRQFSADTMAAGRAVPSKLNQGNYGIQERSAVDFSANIIKTDARGSVGAVPKLGMGNYGYQERSAIDTTSHNIVKTEAKSSGVATKLAMGNYGVQERSHIDTSVGIVKSTAKPVSADVPKLSMGNYGVQERSAIDTHSRSIIKAPSTGGGGASKLSMGNYGIQERSQIDTMSRSIIKTPPPVPPPRTSVTTVTPSGAALCVRCNAQKYGKFCSTCGEMLKPL
eukprot:GILJ01005958.1.p1 GENE.GILJ01005958.1~~GILJ01005958.1.p1  ORF type:complete len:401 (-),score=53.83 GILJ01005958.1:179-1381(-)